MKIGLAQLNYHIGNFEGNVVKIRQAIGRARELGADLAVFAEMAISGYPPRDFLEFPDFIDRCHASALEIARECRGIGAIVGLPVRNESGKGKPLFNAAVLLHEGKIVEMRYKTLLPNYDVFDEYRYFEPNRDFRVVEWKGERIALTVCEDLWNIGNQPLYVQDPMKELAREKPGLIINIAASPFHYEQAGIRKKVLSSNAGRYKIPLFYVNHVGAQTELLFDGGSLVCGPEGTLAADLDYFGEDLKVFDLDTIRGNQFEPAGQTPAGETELIHDALIMGVKNYFGKLGFSKAILGLSGGIDSAVTMVIAARALGSGNVLGVLMPSAFSSGHSVSDAEELASNLGSPVKKIAIEELYETFNKSLKPHFEEHPFDVTEENLQARIRGTLLMAISNKFGHILLNTSNKSEAAVGYGTLYGDMNGGLSVLGDVYKTQVFRLAEYMNRNGTVIPLNSIRKPPSAELRPGQLDTDSLPEYDILDNILYQYIEKRKGPGDLIAMGYDEGVVRRILRLVNTNEYKRHQTPPVLRVSPKAFGMGRRMPIVARYLS